MDEGDKGNSFDAAALAVATLAGSLAIFMGPGPFDWLNGVIGITLFLIIIAYEYESGRERSLLQSLALAAVVSLALLLIVGVGYELIVGNGTLDGKVETDAAKITSVQSGTETSVLAGFWFVLFVIAFLIDVFILRRRNKAKVASQKREIIDIPANAKRPNRDG